MQNAHPNSNKNYRLFWVKYFLGNVGKYVNMGKYSDILTDTLSKKNNKFVQYNTQFYIHID